MRHRRLSLHYVYYVLAAFVVLTVSGSLYITHQLASSFSESIQVNESWANTLSQISSLGELASHVNAPGNDVFDSHDVAAESKRMAAARTEFDRALKNLRREFQSNELGANADSIKKRLDRTAEAMNEMTTEAERIFRYYDLGQAEQAGQRMATMDRKYAELHNSLSRLRASVAEVQMSVFVREQAQVLAARRIEYIMSFAVLVLVALVTIYGHWISRHNERSQEMEVARDKAVELARQKSEFLANMSHEIRTPLHGVLGMTNMIIDSELTAQQREYAQTVRNSAMALLGIVNDILDFSKLEAGKMSIANEPFDLLQLTEDVTELLSATAAEKQLEILLSYSPEMPRHFVGDRDRIRQIFLNLVGNALKFTHSGHVLIEVGMAGKLFRVAVSDTGIGIRQDRLPFLFDQFTQGDESTTRRYGGTGLGLSICKGFIELMKGTIKVESTEGVGSKFTLMLPLRVSSDVSSHPAPAMATPGLRVLIADDHAVSRRILKDQLSDTGHRVEIVGSGKDAIAGFQAAQAAGDPFQVLITDWHMPGMDGVELARQVRECSPATAILLLGAAGQGAEHTTHPQVVIDRYLTKPVRKSKLIDALASIREGRPETIQQAPQRATERRHRAESNTGAQARVLVAEDNPVNQKLALLQLSKFNILADIVTNGHEAVERIQLAPYDFVLMDCAMPEMNGYDATKAIRELNHAVSQVPITAMTANAIAGSKERCLAAGMNDFLTKPFTPADLKMVVDRWCPVRQTSPRAERRRSRIRRPSPVSR